MNKLIESKFKNLSGSWLIFLSTVLWSTAGGVTKSFAMDPILLTALRALIAGVIMLPFLRPKQIVWNRWVFGLILSYTALVLFLLSSFSYTTAANALTLQFTAPLWVFVFGLIGGKNKYTWKSVLPILIMLAGIIVILCEPAGGKNLFGSVLAIGSGVSLAVFSICIKKLQNTNYLGMISLINLCCAALIFIPLLLIPTYEFIIPANAWPYLFFLGGIEVPGGYLFYMMGVAKTSPQRATMLGVWELILTPIWAFLLVRELPSLFGIIGWAILLSALFLDNRNIRSAAQT